MLMGSLRLGARLRLRWTAEGGCPHTEVIGFRTRDLSGVMREKGTTFSVVP